MNNFIKFKFNENYYLSKYANCWVGKMEIYVIKY